MSGKLVKIESLVCGGSGMARADGKVIFVPFSAPGDLLEVEVVDRHRGYDNAVITRIIEPSPCRVEPRCRYFGVCGGCQLQHISYEAQIYWKQKILEEQLLRLGGIEGPPVMPPIPSPAVWGYRSRIQVHRKGGRVGYFKTGSNEIVEIDLCPIAGDRVNGLLKEAKKRWPGGKDRCEIPDGGVFRQVNRSANSELKKVVTEWARDVSPQNVLELYAGSGNLTCELAKAAGSVVAVESCEEAVGEAEKNFRGVKNVRFESTTAEKYLRGAKGRYDLVVVDPPRKGLGKEVVDGIARFKPASIIYVSCDPSTLARDIKQFIGLGYNMIRTGVIDMFPHTCHIESVTILFTTVDISS